MQSQLTIRFLAVCVLALGIGETRAQDFPRPAELEPDIAFWRTIFTEVSDDEGLLHDNRRLDVVYERMAMPARTSRRERNRRVAERRRHYRTILETLAAGKRDGLSDEEARVLALWGPDVDGTELAAATRRIRFQHGLSDRFADSLRRSGRWRPFIEDALERHGVPLQLAALPHVESSYNPAARSHVGASGIWQFTRSTGRRFMQVDHVVDSRNDPWAASEAAARLLAYNYSLTGNWPMAITAYNHGLSGARRAMRQHGDTAYVDILRNYRGRTFGFASRNFYVAFLAALEVDSDAGQYFSNVVPEPPLDYVRFQLDEYVPADALAKALGISIDEFGRYNPALMPIVLRGSKHVPRDYDLRIPRDLLRGSIDDVLAGIDVADRHDRQLPDLFHTIRRGDTLSQIAATYDTNVATLVALNGLGSRHRIRAGQQLRLPQAGPAPAVVAAASPAAPVEDVAVVEEIIADVPAEPEPSEPVDPETDNVLGEDTAETLMGSLEQALVTDPSDYSVADDRTIEVHPDETLGHFADWLDIRTQRLRDVNGFAFRRPVVVGERIELDLGRSTIDEFERRRSAWHKAQQDAFFARHTITGVADHRIAPGESLWVLSNRRYDVPVWLLRQYNPELDLNRVRAGQVVRFPLLETNAG